MIFSFFIKIAKVFSSISITYFEVIYNLMDWLQNQKKFGIYFILHHATYFGIIVGIKYRGQPIKLRWLEHSVF